MMKRIIGLLLCLLPLAAAAQKGKLEIETLYATGAVQGLTATVTTAQTACTLAAGAAGCAGLAYGDCGARIIFSANSAVAVTAPTGLPVGCRIELTQGGSGTVSVTAGTGATVHTGLAAAATAGQYNVIVVTVEATSTFTVSMNNRPPGAVAFSPLHTYYLAASGCSDANAGTSAAAPWCTPNHAVVCGDVIIAAAGTYTQTAGLGTWGTVSSCPSTTGGIDGAGGVYFATLLCGGSDLTACKLTCSSCASGQAAMNVNKSNWAVEGWALSSAGAIDGFCGLADGGASGTTIVHHVAFVNNTCINAGIGFSTNDSGLNHNVPGNGVDYFAAIGNIAQNANQRQDFPSAAIVLVGAANSDTTAGVHAILAGNFAINNQCVSTYSDCEGMMIDTLDAHGYVGGITVANNVVYASSWVGMQTFMQSYNSSAPAIRIYHNTFFDDGVCTPFNTGVSGEQNLQLDGGFPWTITVTNNIARTNRATVGCSTGSPYLYGLLIGGANGVSNIVLTVGGSGAQNIYKGQAGTCANSCDSGNNVVTFNGFGFGTNTYVDPAFKNTTDLLSNHLGAPSCASFVSVAACMGWNNATQTAASLSVIDDLTATASGMAGKGYQPPGPCASDANYPAWLKGIVYLHWTGSAVTENAGLVNKPCNL